MFCKECGSHIDSSSSYCPICGYRIEGHQSYHESEPAEGMIWFKFLIYFSLFISALLNIVNGFKQLTGNIYGENAEAIYDRYVLLSILDFIIGFAVVFLGFFCLYVRSRLAGFYKNGPKSLLTLYLAALVINLIYIIGVYSILPEDILTDSNILSGFVYQLIIYIAMIFINKSYFNKRKDQFIY